MPGITKIRLNTNPVKTVTSIDNKNKFVKQDKEVVNLNLISSSLAAVNCAS